VAQEDYEGATSSDRQEGDSGALGPTEALYYVTAVYAICRVDWQLAPTASADSMDYPSPYRGR
jgi:hypothetical protein